MNAVPIEDGEAHVLLGVGWSQLSLGGAEAAGSWSGLCSSSLRPRGIQSAATARDMLVGLPSCLNPSPLRRAVAPSTGGHVCNRIAYIIVSSLSNGGVKACVFIDSRF